MEVDRVGKAPAPGVGGAVMEKDRSVQVVNLDRQAGDRERDKAVREVSKDNRLRLVRSKAMLYWAVVFFIVAIIAAVFGFGGIAAGAATIAQVLFFVFLVVFLASLIAGLARRHRHA